jgi:hypothetical protein
MTSKAVKDLTRIINEMRSERGRYKSHDLGFVDSVSANCVDDWADELEALMVRGNFGRTATRVSANGGGT